MCAYFLQMERQMVMQQIMRQRMMAQQLAMGRELAHWWLGFYAVSTTVLLAG